MSKKKHHRDRDKQNKDSIHNDIIFLSMPFFLQIQAPPGKRCDGAICGHSVLNEGACVYYRTQRRGFNEPDALPGTILCTTCLNVLAAESVAKYPEPEEK